MAAPSRSCAAFWPAISAGFLIALGRIVGSRIGTILAPALSSASKIAATARSGSTTTVLPLSSASALSNSRALVQANAVAEMLADVGTDLLGRDEQIGGAVGVDQRIGQSDRRVGDVRAADVERPGDRIRAPTAPPRRRAAWRSQSPISVRFSAADLPAYWSGWTTRWAFDASGRSVQISSIGLRSTGTSSAPRAGQRFLRLLRPSRGCAATDRSRSARPRAHAP